MKVFLFTKHNCPRCPQAKEVIKDLREVKSMDLVEFDVDTGEGMYSAIEHGVSSTPTILIEGTEGVSHRFSGEITIEQVEKVLK